MKYTPIATKLIEAGARVNDRDIDGYTPLMRAIESDNLALASTLIAAGADVNAKNEDGKTPLMMAIDNHNIHLIKKLIEAGADVNAKDEDGKTPLMHAVSKRDINSLETLIDAGVDVGVLNAKTKKEIFEYYIYNKPNLRIIKTFIEAGVDVNAPPKPPLDDYPTPLMRAIESDNLALASTLIAAGADVSTLDATQKQNILAYAIQSDGNSRVIENLIKAGVDVNARDIDGYTPLINAINMNYTPIATKLIEAGARVNDRDIDGYSPLMRSIQSQNINLAKKMIALGANVNAKLDSGKTVLDLAIETPVKEFKKLIKQHREHHVVRPTLKPIHTIQTPHAGPVHAMRPQAR
jgi:ankyrin repeat protein